MKAAALRRHWWVILLCIIMAASAAYAIGLLRSQTSTAESVAIVSAGVISGGPGAVDQSFRLASDYSKSIPRDDAILEYIERQAGVPARGKIQAQSETRSSLLDISFTASDESSALAGVRTLTSAIAGEAPVSSAVTPDSLTVVDAPSVAQQGPGGFTATVVMLTSSGGGRLGPGYGDQAVKLGPSYASSIADDAQVLRFVAKRLNTSVDEVDDHTTVKNDKDTSVLRMQYRAVDDDEAEKGAWAMADAVTGPAPVTNAVEAGTIALVRKGKAESPSAAPGVTLPVGALLGLCLGIVLMLALERADPRVDDPEQLEEEFRCPSILIDEVVPSMAAALLERWSVLTGRDSPTVALIPASPDLEAATAGLASKLVSQAGEVGEGPNAMTVGIRLVIGRYPGADLSGASLAASSDGVVLVTTEGAGLDSVRATRQALERFEAPPQWTVLLTRSSARSLAREQTAPAASRPVDASRV